MVKTAFSGRAAFFLALVGLAACIRLDTGVQVARTPPLGWLSWQRYRCNRNCAADPENCFSEQLIKRTADLMVSEGYKDAGYEYVCLDDCWQAKHRVNGHVVADPENFPSGIKVLADYVHSKGLKLGLYTAMGNGTCAMGGTLGLGCDRWSLKGGCATAKQDLEDYVSWGIDHLKVDGCLQFDHEYQNQTYAVVGQHLREAAGKVNRSVVYHPSNLGFQYPRQLRELSAIANQWRWFDDVQDSWRPRLFEGHNEGASVSEIIEALGAGQPECIPGSPPASCYPWGVSIANHSYAITCASYCTEARKFHEASSRPGSWQDPDMLIVGNTPCSAQVE